MMAASSRVSRARTLAFAAAPLLVPLRALAQAQVTAPLRIACTANDTYAEAYFGQDGGIFRQRGLVADLTTFTNGQQVVTAIVTGNADVGVTNPTSLAQAVQHGLELTIVAGAAYYVSEAATTALYAAKESPLKAARDLEGQIVALGTTKDSSAAFFFNYLATNGVDVAKVNLIEMPFSEMGPALKRGTVAAASIPEPYYDGSKADLKLFAKYFDATSKRFLLCCWVSTPAFVQKNPALVRQFADAIYATAKWANAHRDETAPIIAKYSKIDPAVTARMTRATYAEKLDPVEVQPTFDVSYKFKLIDSPVKAADLIAKF